MNPAYKELLTEDEFLQHIRNVIAQSKTQKQFTEWRGISRPYLSDVLGGRRAPGPKMLKAFSFERVTMYRVANKHKG